MLCIRLSLAFMWECLNSQSIKALDQTNYAAVEGRKTGPRTSCSHPAWERGDTVAGVGV